MNEIKEYLESLLDDFNGNMIDLKKEMDDLDLQLKENIRFVNLLKEENDKPFSEFSPRDTNVNSEDKIKELDELVDKQTTEKENLQTYIDQVQDKIDELLLMIGKMEIYEIDNNAPSQKETDNSSSNDNHPSKNDVVKSNIDTILGFLPADPMRAKIELENLKEKI